MRMTDAMEPSSTPSEKLLAEEWEPGPVAWEAPSPPYSLKRVAEAASEMTSSSGADSAWGGVGAATFPAPAFE